MRPHEFRDELRRNIPLMVPRPSIPWALLLELVLLLLIAGCLFYAFLGIG